MKIKQAEWKIYQRHPKALEIASSVFQIPDYVALTPVSEKLPSLTKDWQKEAVEKKEIARWILKGVPTISQKGNEYTKFATGYGLLSGQHCGILTIDFDGVNATKLFRAMFGDELADKYACVDTQTVGWSSYDPTGKTHLERFQLAFKVPQEMWEQLADFTRRPVFEWEGVDAVENKYLDKDGNERTEKEQLDFRWNRCQSVLPPSIHPKRGQYKWLKSFKDVEVADCPQEILDVLVKFANGDLKRKKESEQRQIEIQKFRQEALKKQQERRRNGDIPLVVAQLNPIEFLHEYVLPAVGQVYDWHGHQFKRVGDKLVGYCPQHGGSSGTAFQVNEIQETWYCHGCGVGGGPVNYWRFKNGYSASLSKGDYREAVLEMAREHHVPIPRTTWDLWEEAGKPRPFRRWAEMRGYPIPEVVANYKEKSPEENLKDFLRFEVIGEFEKDWKKALPGFYEYEYENEDTVRGEIDGVLCEVNILNWEWIYNVNGRSERWWGLTNLYGRCMNLTVIENGQYKVKGKNFFKVLKRLAKLAGKTIPEFKRQWRSVDEDEYYLEAGFTDDLARIECLIAKRAKKIKQLQDKVIRALEYQELPKNLKCYTPGCLPNIENADMDVHWVYKPEDRQTFWLEAIRKHYKHILDDSEAGSGKSHAVGDIAPDMIHASDKTRIWYLNKQYRNPTVASIEKHYWPVPSKHEGLDFIEGKKTPLGHPQLARFKWSEGHKEPDVAATCINAGIYQHIYEKGYFIGAGKGSPICQSCPLFREKSCGYLKESQKKSNKRQLRADPHQINALRPTDVVFIDEGLESGIDFVKRVVMVPGNADWIRKEIKNIIPGAVGKNLAEWWEDVFLDPFVRSLDKLKYHPIHKSAEHTDLLSAWCEELGLVVQSWETHTEVLKAYFDATLWDRFGEQWIAVERSYYRETGSFTNESGGFEDIDERIYHDEWGHDSFKTVTDDQGEVAFQNWYWKDVVNDDGDVVSRYKVQKYRSKSLPDSYCNFGFMSQLADILFSQALKGVTADKAEMLLYIENYVYPNWLSVLVDMVMGNKNIRATANNHGDTKSVQFASPKRDSFKILNDAGTTIVMDATANPKHLNQIFFREYVNKNVQFEIESARFINRLLERRDLLTYELEQDLEAALSHARRKIAHSRRQFLVCRQEPSDFSKLKIHLVQGMGQIATGRTMECNQNKRVSAAVDAIIKKYPEMKIGVIDKKTFVKMYKELLVTIGWWFFSNRGSNEFQHHDVLIGVSTPVMNMSASAEEYQVLFGIPVSLEDNHRWREDDAPKFSHFGDYMRVKSSSEVIQAIARLRAQRGDTEKNYWHIGDLDELTIADILEKFPGSSCEVVAAYDLCPDAASKGIKSLGLIKEALMARLTAVGAAKLKEIASDVQLSEAAVTQNLKTRYGRGFRELTRTLVLLLDVSNRESEVELPADLKEIAADFFPNLKAKSGDPADFVDATEERMAQMVAKHGEEAVAEGLSAAEDRQTAIESYFAVMPDSVFKDAQELLQATVPSVVKIPIRQQIAV